MTKLEGPEPLQEEFILNKESVTGNVALFVGAVCAKVADSGFICSAVSGFQGEVLRSLALPFDGRQ